MSARLGQHNNPAARSAALWRKPEASCGSTYTQSKPLGAKRLQAVCRVDPRRKALLGAQRLLQAALAAVCGLTHTLAGLGAQRLPYT